MRFSIVSLSKCAKYDFGYFLWSPEFFQKENLSLRESLQNRPSHSCSHYFKHVKDNVSAINERVVCYDLTDGLTKFFDGGKKTDCISSSKKLALAGDFAISRLRSYLEEMGIIEEKETKQVLSTEFLVFRQIRKGLSVHTLFALCMTEAIQKILKAGQYGTEHPRFYEVLLEELPIPDSLLAIDSNISATIKQALQCRKLSGEMYQQAQTILLSELGLTNWQPKHQLTFTKNYSDAEQAGRIDAEYYQPKYGEIIKVIKNYSGGWDTLENLCKTKRGSLISEEYYSDEGVLYIRGADFSGGALSSKKGIYISNDFNYKNETTVKEGEIVFSLIGSVGETAFVTSKFEGSYISNNTGKISCNKHGINSWVLQILLQSFIGQMYFEKHKTQTAQPKISNTDIHDFVIPILSKEKQIQIQKKITESFRLREQSKNLLESAKKAVEIAIEQDEPTAIR